mgnify:FL=1|tara:strand:+ start:22 stop:525 length:504 start_codon:yes stop_codon:yes gene_type:complete
MTSQLNVDDIRPKAGSGSISLAFYAEAASQYTITANTYVQNTVLTDNEIDTHSAFASSKFTVPTDYAGLYMLYYVAYIDFDGIGDDGKFARSAIYKNGVAIANHDITDNSAADILSVSVAVSTMANLSAGDEITFYNRASDASGSNPTVQGNNISGGYTFCYGYRIV